MPNRRYHYYDSGQQAWSAVVTGYGNNGWKRRARFKFGAANRVDADRKARAAFEYKYGKASNGYNIQLKPLNVNYRETDDR